MKRIREAANYRKIREEVELEKPEIIRFPSDRGQFVVECSTIRQQPIDNHESQICGAVRETAKVETQRTQQTGGFHPGILVVRFDNDPCGDTIPHNDPSVSLSFPLLMLRMKPRRVMID